MQARPEKTKDIWITLQRPQIRKQYLQINIFIETGNVSQDCVCCARIDLLDAFFPKGRPAIKGVGKPLDARSRLSDSLYEVDGALGPAKAIVY